MALTNYKYQYMYVYIKQQINRLLLDFTASWLKIIDSNYWNLTCGEHQFSPQIAFTSQGKCSESNFPTMCNMLIPTMAL